MKQKRISIILLLLLLITFVQCAGHKAEDNAYFLVIDTGSDEVDAGENDELNGLCKPCSSNKDCEDLGGTCVANLETGEYFCTRNCSVEPCPKGFYCMPNPWDIDAFKQCMPTRSDISCGDNVYDLPF